MVEAPSATELVLREVGEERQAQDGKWGKQNHENFLWMTVLSEEVGEAAKAAMHDMFGGPDAGNLRAELVQVAAVAVAWIECLDRER